MLGQVSFIADITEHEFHAAFSASPGHRAGVGAVARDIHTGEPEGIGEQGLDLAFTAARGVLCLCLGDDGLPVDLLELQADDRVFTGADDDLGELGGPTPDVVQCGGHVIAAEVCLDGTVVQVRQSGSGHLLQSRDPWGDGGENQGFTDAQFGFGRGSRHIFVPGVRGQLIGLEDQGAQLVLPEGLAEFEPAGGVGLPHLGVAGDEVVEGVADGDHGVDAHRGLLVDEHGFHDLQGGAFALHDRREVDQGVDEHRGEGEGEFEAVDIGGLVVLVGVDSVEQHVHHFGTQAQVLEGLGQLQLGTIVQRAQQTLLGDHRQVTAAEFDGVEAAFLVLEGLAAGLDLPASLHGGVFPRRQVVLAGNEGDDGDVELTLAGLDEQGQLLGLALEGLVGAHEHQPQDQLVEEQDDALVIEGLGVPGDLGQPVCQGDPLGVGAVGGEEGLGEGTGELTPLVLGGGGGACRLVGRRVPASACRRGGSGVGPGGTEECAEVDPAGVSGTGGYTGLVQGREECFVAHGGAGGVGVGEKFLGGVQHRQGGTGVQLLDLRDVATEDGVFDGPGVEEVERQLQQVAADGVALAAVAADQWLQVGVVAGGGLIGEHGEEHRHEVGLTGAEGAGEVHTLVVAGGQCPVDVAECGVEVVGDLVSDHVAVDGVLQLVVVTDGVGELQDEGVPGSVGDVEDLAEQRGGGGSSGEGECHGVSFVVLLLFLGSSAFGRCRCVPVEVIDEDPQTTSRFFQLAGQKITEAVVRCWVNFVVPLTNPGQYLGQPV